MHQPVARIRRIGEGEVRHPSFQAVQELGEQGFILLPPQNMGGNRRMQQRIRQLKLVNALVIVAWWGQRAGAVVVAGRGK